MEGARLLHEHGRDLDTVQSVFRVHLPPLSQRLRELRATLAVFVQTHNLSDQWEWKHNTSLADYLAGLPTDPESQRLRTAVERQVRGANRSSHYSPHAGPHFALGVDQYARFTAPMREIVGIFTHKEVLEAVGLEQAQNNDDDNTLREEVIEAANQGTNRQRTVDKELTLLAIQQDLLDDLDLPLAQRPRRTGTVVGIKPTRFYVLLDTLPMDVKVYLDSLEAHTGQTFESNHVVISSAHHSFKLGDAITLITHSWDDEQRRIVLIPEQLLNS
jgi:ribonuclease R